MSWRDNLRQASFRGAAFHVDTHDHETGRRAAIHEFPLRDTPQVDDLGRKARRHSVEAFVLGTDYMAARDALLEACEAEGPGTLVHPYLGSVEVQCLECRVRESRQEGGWARVSLTFVEAGARLYPSSGDGTSAAADNVNAILDSFMTAFAATYDADLPDWSANAFLGDLAAAFGYISQVVAVIPDASGVTAIASFLATVDAAAGSVQAVIADGQALAQQVSLALAGLTSTGASTSATVEAAVEVSQWGTTGSTSASALDDIPLTTASRQTQAANREALLALVRRLALAHGVKAALTMPLDSYQQARAVAQTITDRLEDLLLEAGDQADDAGFAALSILRAESLPALQARAAKLPHLRVLTAPPGPAPTLVIAHDLYEDCGRAEEIAQRNRIRHPLFPPGDQPLEVLYV